MAGLFKRGETYYADIWRDGQRVKLSLRTQDRQVAKARLRSAELGASNNAAQAEKFLAAAIDQANELKKPATRQQYTAKALHLLRVLGDVDINTITRAQVSEYTTRRLKEGSVRHTVHKELVVLRQALKEAQKRGEYRGPLDVVPAWSADYQPRTRWLTVKEFGKLFAAARLKRRTWLMLQVYAGANMGECSRMTWDCVDFKNGRLTIPGTKRTSRFRQVPIHPTLLAWLEGCDRQQPLVERWVGVNTWLAKTCKEFGIPSVSTNDLRRTFAAWLKQAGVDSLPVAHMMGHSSTAMVERVYGRLSQKTYDAAIAHLPDYRPTGVPVKAAPVKKARKNK